MRKTGGGATPGDLTAFWGRIIGIIGNTPIDGIPGGIDMGDNMMNRLSGKREPWSIT